MTIEEALKQLIAAAAEAVYREPTDDSHGALEEAIEQAHLVLKLSSEPVPVEGGKTVS